MSGTVTSSNELLQVGEISSFQVKIFTSNWYSPLTTSKEVAGKQHQNNIACLKKKAVGADLICIYCC